MAAAAETAEDPSKKKSPIGIKAGVGGGIKTDGTLTKGAIEQIVTGAILSVFTLAGGLTRPPHYISAWQLDADEVKPCSDHFVRWLQTFEPERLVSLAKYVDPVLGCCQLFNLYQHIRRRETELDAYYAEFLKGAPPQGEQSRANGAAAGSSVDHGRNPERSPAASNGQADGDSLPTNLYC